MTAKRFAKVALVVLVILIALCVFFSGTIRTMLNPTVSVLTAKTGVLSTPFTFSCTLEYQFPQRLILSIPAETLNTLIVTKSVPVVGERVNRLDLLYTFEYDGVEKEQKRLEKALRETVTQLTTAQMNYEQAKPRKSEKQYFEAYEALIDARNQEYLAAYELKKLGYTTEKVLEMLELDTWGENDPIVVMNQYGECVENLAQAEKNYKKVQDSPPRSSVMNAYEYLKRAKEQVEEAQKDLNELSQNAAQVSLFRSPKTGIVSTSYVKLGDKVNNGALLCEICDEKDIVLTARITGLDVLPRTGTTVTISTDYGKLESVIDRIGLDSYGRQTMTIRMPEDLAERGISLRMMESSMKTVSGVVQSDQEYTLLPAGAVHGSGDKRYIYLLSDKETVLGGKGQIVTQFPVTVMSEAGGMIGIKETLGTKKIAYLENKPLENGQTVTLTSDLDWGENK